MNRGTQNRFFGIRCNTKTEMRLPKGHLRNTKYLEKSPVQHVLGDFQEKRLKKYKELEYEGSTRLAKHLK